MRLWPPGIPETPQGQGESTILIEGGDEAMGGATVAVQIGEALYLGSFVGDRIARVELPAPASTDLVP